ncbi:MAG: Flp pilus assembly protein CpaB [Kiritimatiellae bacterium]|nr:Flp pilus assembly protein CpaB [Kiritimatiellia bacterium]
MKRKIVLVVSLLAGVAAAVLARLYVAAKDAEVAALKDAIHKRYGTIEVLIFARDTPAGTVLQRGDLLKMEVPALGMRGQALTEENLRDVVGRKTLLTHRFKDIVFWADIEGGKPADAGLSADIKKTMRAISINCSGAASVSGMVRPNDHVDVIGTFDLSEPQSSQAAKAKSLVTCTILQNVLVLATGPVTAKTNVRQGALPNGYSTVTLEVTPREAEMLAFAEQIRGRLVLTLRNRNDTHAETELPNVDFDKIRGEIEELNQRRQQQRLSVH